jgi:hypothetical protein
MTQSSESPSKTKRYLDFKQACVRYGNCSSMYIERLIENDPDFPRPITLGPKGRKRFLDVDLLDEYDAKCAERGRRLGK